RARDDPGRAQIDARKHGTGCTDAGPYGARHGPACEKASDQSQTLPHVMSGPRESPRTRRRVGRGQRLIFTLVAVLMVLLAAEVVARLYWCVRGTSFFGAPRELHRIYYTQLPFLRSAARPDGYTGHDTFDILFLGGSVVNPDLGSIQLGLFERTRAMGLKTR